MEKSLEHRQTEVKIMVKRKHIQELYYIRAIAALGILIIHATGSFAVYSEFNSKAMYLGIFANQFFRFGSPIFMMISGLVLFYNYRSMEEFNAKDFYKKKLLYIIVPYIIWSIIYFTYKNFGKALIFNKEGIVMLIKEILRGSSFSHLYFITLILQFYIILPLFIKFLIKPMKKKPIKLFVSLFILQAIILVYGRYFRDFSATGLLGFFNIYYWKSIFGWFFYFLVGGILGIHYDKIVEFINNNIRPIFLFYIVTTFFYLGQVYYSIWKNSGRDFYDNFGSIRPETLIYAICTMPILIWITRKMVGKFPIAKTFGTYSLGIYFAHPIILEMIKLKIFGRYPNIFGYSRLTSMFTLVTLGIVLTFIFVLIIGSLKYRGLLLGKIPRFSLKKKIKNRN